MKTFWKKMFWWDAPAKGAFFALTLLLVGTYVQGSIFLFVWEMGWLGRSRRLWPEPGVWLVYLLVPIALLLLYYLFETLFFFFRSGKGWVRYVGIVGLPLWIGFGIVLLSCNRHVFGEIVLLWGMAFFAVILPLSACCGKHWRWAAAGILTWCIGVFLVWDAFPAFNAVLDPFRFVARLSNGEPEVKVVVIPLVQQLGISGYGWTAWFALVCLLFAGWYLLTAKLFAGMGNCRFRAMFGRPVLALWCVKILIYLTFSGMVIYEKGQLSRYIAELEQRFGRPVTAKALGELYFGGEQPDAEFWRQMQRRREEDDFVTLSYANVLSFPKAELSDTDQRKFRNSLEEPASTANRWEQLFSGPVPPPPNEFKEGMLYAIDFSYLFVIRKLDCLLLWRIRFALSDRRIDDALAAYRRMEQVNRLLRRETSVVGGMTWTAVENLRLNGVEMLLESGRLTDSQLRKISSELMPIELEIPRMQERSLYGEAVYSVDACDGLTTGTLEKDTCYDHPKPVPVRVLRYYFPQFWWFCLREKAEMARQFNVPDFSCISSNPSDLPILGEMCLPGLGMGNKRFADLAARLRGMRALIAAELWKREHGKYPDTLPSVPEDPRTGKPLFYRKGESRIQVEHFTFNRDTGNWDSRTEELTVPAIQLWSPAAGDDGWKNRTRALRKL